MEDRNSSNNVTAGASHEVPDNYASGEEVVISGVAGVLPNSRNLDEFKESLYNKVNMVKTNTRWDFDHPDIPECSGIIPGIAKYDGGFFGVHDRQSQSLDPQNRIFQEKVMEAIFDAGIHPSELEGTKTGVYVALGNSETDKAWFFDNLSPQTFAITGCEKSMVAHRISYFLKLKGPSVVVDTACSSSFYSLENAYKAMTLGEIDNAIVGGTNLCLYPLTTMQFLRLGVLSKDSSCKAFDASGNGYVRSEAVAVVLLQKAKNAKRIYAHIVHARTNSDGFKEQGITFPSKIGQTNLLREFYKECHVDTHRLCFLEAHGTGTKVGDPEECGAIDDVLANGRTKPLLIGSVKSNIGHSETASGLCSVFKCILAMETGYIPPNLHFNTPKKEIKGLLEGRLKVAVDKIPLEDGNALIGINNFGFGGSNGHVLLQRHSKEKNGFLNNLPNLVCVSGRTEEAVSILINQISINGNDREYVTLLNEVFRKNIPNHLYRGYAMVSRKYEKVQSSTKFCSEYSKPLYLAFGELGNLYEIGKQLMNIPAFSKSIERINKHLMDRGINILETFVNNNSHYWESIPVLGSVAIQVALIDVLNMVEIKAVTSSGFYFGKLISAYHNDILTLEETIHYAFALNEGVLRNGEWCKLKENLNKLNCMKLGSDIENIKMNSVVLKVGNCPFHEIQDVVVVPVFESIDGNHFEEFVTALGRLYTQGYNPQISKLYPQIKFPVSRGTPMISPHISWKHNRDQFTLHYNLDIIRQTKQRIGYYRIETNDYQWKFVTGYIIDGRNIFPVTGYLYMVWETFMMMEGVPLNVSRVTIENCRFTKITSIPATNVVFSICIQIDTGNFEVVEGDMVVLSGRIKLLPESEVNLCYFGMDSEECHSVEMCKKDVYKELRLRGYNYSGEFKLIEKYSKSLSKGHVKWEENWVTFIDNMLQVKILEYDTRSLYLPVFISKINIVADTHYALIKETYKDLSTPPILPVYSDCITGEVKCGGITISGIIASPVAKKDLFKPVLETYEFISNSVELDTKTSIRVNMQIILENTINYEMKVVELVDEFTNENIEPLSPIIKSVLKDEPLVQTFIKILSKNTFNVDIKQENKVLGKETKCQLVIASKILERPKTIKQALAALKEDGYIMSRESCHFDFTKRIASDIVCITVHRAIDETIILLQKQSRDKTVHYMKISSSENFSWVPKLQFLFSKHPEDDIVLYSEKESTNGVLGLVNCLRTEPCSKNVRCVFIMDNDEAFNPNSPMYSNQLKKNMAINVYKNGQWGTYRHLLINQSKIVESEHSFLAFPETPELSNIEWIEGPPICNSFKPGVQVIEVCYVSLSTSDISIVNGKSKNVSFSNELKESRPGFDFAGRDNCNNQMMGFTTKGALTNLLLVDPLFTYPVPSDWTLEDAATVPMAYITVIYALIIRGNLKKGESILLQCGNGDIRHAAIYIALHFGCQVFTTVSTQEECESLKRKHPQLKDKNIGNTHESCEQLVYRGTNGKGVDLVLNSLHEEKLIASVRCLAQSGRFLQIEEFDLSNNIALNMFLFQGQAEFHGSLLNRIFTDSPEIQFEISSVFQRLLNEKVIKPLERTVFKYNECEEAFKCMTCYKSNGKVIIKIRDSDSKLDIQTPVQKFQCTPRYYCDDEGVYIIVGGLGGFGLELADWLILRGARKLVLTSRKGITTGYQDYRIRSWKSQGAIVKVMTASLHTKESCKRFIEESLQLGRITAIFNLAVVLEDAVFENQTPKSFTTSFIPKAYATEFLDDLTREMCQDLREFIVFSSICCGRGNPGQTNYGMANSVMERICENRKLDGLPGLAIEWGAIGEVGLLVEMQGDRTGLQVRGTVQQHICSCLQVLDILLTQKEAAIVSSMVVAEKKGVQSSDDIVDAIVNLLGLKDSKCISNHSTLTELGMDSITAIQIRKILEKEFSVFLSIHQLRTMTLDRIKTIQGSNQESNENTESKQNQQSEVIQIIYDLIEDESNSSIPCISLSTNAGESKLPRIVLFPGIEGFATVFKRLSTRILDASAIQYVLDGRTTSIASIVQSVMPIIVTLVPSNGPFTIVAYSYGTLIALEVVNLLERLGYKGTLICVDGSPLLMKRLLKNFTSDSEQLFQNNIISWLLSFAIPSEHIAKNKINISRCKTWEEKVDLGVELVKIFVKHKPHYLRIIFNTIYGRLKDLDTYKCSCINLKSNIKLFKPKSATVKDIVEDYGLSEFFQNPIEIQYFEGSHETILQNEKLCEII